MKKQIVTLLISIIAATAFSQPSQKLEENKPSAINGIEYTYRINQESTKKSGDDEYSRYVLEFYAINKSGCSRYIPYRDSYSTTENSTNNLIATFLVRNANGKRLTNKDAGVYAKQWWAKVKLNEKDSNGKNVVRLRDTQVGYVFRKGDQLKAQITVLVPLGEKPNVEITPAYLPDDY